jgi:hypothetical protein
MIYLCMRGLDLFGVIVLSCSSDPGRCYILLATPLVLVPVPLFYFHGMELVATIACCHHVMYSVPGTVKACLVVVRSICFRVILIITERVCYDIFRVIEMYLHVPKFSFNLSC